MKDTVKASKDAWKFFFECSLSEQGALLINLLVLDPLGWLLSPPGRMVYYALPSLALRKKDLRDKVTAGQHATAYMLIGLLLLAGIHPRLAAQAFLWLWAALLCYDAAVYGPGAALVRDVTRILAWWRDAVRSPRNLVLPLTLVLVFALGVGLVWMSGFPQKVGQQVDEARERLMNYGLAYAALDVAEAQNPGCSVEVLLLREYVDGYQFAGAAMMSAGLCMLETTVPGIGSHTVDNLLHGTVVVEESTEPSKQD